MKVEQWGKDYNYFSEREERREKYRERNISVWNKYSWVPLAASQFGTCPLPTHVHWVRINKTPFCFRLVLNPLSDNSHGFLWFWFFFLTFIYFICREREVEKYQCVLSSHTSPTGDLAHSWGMCPDWEMNRQPFGLQAGVHSTGPHQLGLWRLVFRNVLGHLWCANCFYLIEILFILERRE